MTVEINPLDVLKKREVNYLPPHFSKTSILSINEISIKTWIKTNLKGRFCLIKVPGIGTDNKLKSTIILAFEDEKELIYFMLACPHLRRK